MIKKVKPRSKKTENRINDINLVINFHKENIELLKHARSQYLENKTNSFVPRVIRYSSLPKIPSMFNFTLNNLQTQISLLEKERDVLIEFGV